MNEQLTSDELRQVLAEWIRLMYPKERQKIAGLFEAVIARAEAAKAEAARLAARVAELESQLAAQQWRPVTEEPPLPDKYYLTDDTLPLGNEPFIVNYYSARREWANRCRVWFCPPPLPPAPQETEKPS